MYKCFTTLKVIIECQIRTHTHNNCTQYLYIIHTTKLRVKTNLYVKTVKTILLYCVH